MKEKGRVGWEEGGRRKEGRKEGREERRKEERREGRKEGRKEGRVIGGNMMYFIWTWKPHRWDLHVKSHSRREKDNDEMKSNEESWVSVSGEWRSTYRHRNRWIEIKRKRWNKNMRKAKLWEERWQEKRNKRREEKLIFLSIQWRVYNFSMIW